MIHRNNKVQRAMQLKEKADLAFEQRDYENARALYEASLERFQQRQHWEGIFIVRLSLGHLAFQQQDYSTAHSQYQQCVNMARNVQRLDYLF